jgi:hypothetical protein
VVIKFADGGVSYEIPVAHKITMITGLSATGKSAALRVLRGALLSGTGVQGVAADSILILDTNAAAVIRETRMRVYFVDTDIVLPSREFCRAVNGARAYFVLFGRAVIGGLSVHYKAVLRFPEGATREHVARPAFAGLKTGLNPALCTVTEDSSGGALFFRLFYSSIGSGAEVYPAGGFGNIARTIAQLRQNGVTEIQVVADAATFGNVVEDILVFDGLTFFLPECMEQIYLMCPMFDQEYRKRFNPLEYPSAEAFYTHELAEQLRPTHGENK